MGRAFLCFGAAVVACWRGEPLGPPGNHVAASAPPALVGDYRCTITMQGYSYPPFPCGIRQVSTELVLEKRGGSIWFHGILRATTAVAYRFEGDVYCPHADCERHVIGVFERRQDGTMVGNLGEIGIYNAIVQLTPASGFGGDGYGGAGYGGATYGTFRPLPGP
jgi:hypothetical protein